MAIDDENFELSFTVPKEFDCCQAEIALRAVEELVDVGGYHHDAGLMSAYRLLYCVHTKYVEQLGRPEWKRPRLNFGEDSSLDVEEEDDEIFTDSDRPCSGSGA